MAYSSGQLNSKQERNRVNEAMRASDVWRNAIKGMGLNPDGLLNLNKSQQAYLAQVLEVPTSDFHIDPAGNINDFHGWKGLPTAVKIGAIAAAALGTAGAAGAFGGGAIGATSAAAAPAATGATAATTATTVGGGMGMGMKILDMVKGIAPILGGAAKGRADTQQQNNTLDISRANVDLNRREYMRDSPGIRSRAAAKSSMIANYQPTSIKLGAPGFGERGESPSFTGGFNNADMYSPEARQVANESIKAHLLASLNGADHVPEIPTPGKSSALDKILGAGGFASSIFGAIPSGVFKKNTPRPLDEVYRPDQ